MRRTAPALVLVALLAAGTRAAAHSVAVLPSHCAFDPIAVTAPGAAVTVAPATAADQLAITYDTGASQATFDLRTVPARALDASGTAGSLDLPDLFQAILFANGDLTVAGLMVDLTMGAASASLPVSLTTGLVTLGGNVSEGSPLGADGRFTLVGGAPSIALSPFDGAPVVVRLTCQADPVPDLDQFRIAPELAKLSATLKNGVLTLKAQLVLADKNAPDLTGMTAALRASIGSATVAATAFATPLARRGKAFVTEAPDGGMLSLRVVHAKAPTKIALKARLPGAAVAVTATAAQVTVDVGGLLARLQATIKRKGGRAVFHGA
jgi:hypothetical protein